MKILEKNVAIHTVIEWGVSDFGNHVVLLLILLFGIYGCNKKVQDNDYLIRVGNSTISVLEFKHAVEAAEEEIFIGEQDVGPIALRDLQVRVLNQLTEEIRGAPLLESTMILLETIVINFTRGCLWIAAVK